MTPESEPRSDCLSSEEIASELNNLLQIVSGSGALIEDIWQGKPGANQYFAMLRQSVARAAELTAELVERSGHAQRKIVLHPAFNRLQNVATQRRGASQQRIMVVDDEKMLLILTADMLREAGFDVVTASSGFECLDQFRLTGRRFDLVLLDLHMPLMDGEETFRRLRAIQPDVRVMLSTGYIAPEKLKQMLEAGLSGVVQKPLGPREYLASVQAVLEEPPITSCASA